ncbi:MAG: helix-turn-helix domain-containing protein [Thermodesulfobacteriota bacterium]
MARPKKSAHPVPLFALSSRERELLAGLLVPPELTPEARRAQGLLWLDAGHSPQTVAKRLRVSRQTVYNWVANFRRRSQSVDIRVQLADRPRSGRPRTLPKTLDPLLVTIVRRPPCEVGYRAWVWNASLLGQYLKEVHHIAVTRASVTVALKRLGIRLRVVALQPHERDELERRARHAGLTREGQQAQALLWLDAGESVRKVAARLRTSRQTVYNWITQFQERRGMTQRLPVAVDGHGSHEGDAHSVMHMKAP